MGIIVIDSVECGPNGDTIVTVHATNGTVPVYINGIETSTLTGGPGTYTAVWYNPATTERIPQNVWGTQTITVEALTDCELEQAPPTTTGPPVPTTTGTPVGVNLPCPLPTFRPGIGWECPPESVSLACPLPMFNGTEWVCPTTTTVTPVAIDLTETVCTDGQETCVEVGVPPVPNQLPATGGAELAALGVSGFMFVLAGGIAVYAAARRRAVTS